MPEYVELTGKAVLNPKIILGEIIKHSIQQQAQAQTKNSTETRAESQKR